MINARRLRHATLATNDVDRLVDYYESIIGLVQVGRAAGRVFLATESGQLAIVVESGEPRCRALALDISPNVSLEDARRALSDNGISTTLLSDSAPGVANTLRFTDMEGREVELISGSHSFDNRGAVSGIGPTKLGHVALYTRDPQSISKYYGDLLGFRVSDWIEDRFVFMRCGFEHHTMNFTTGPEVRVHHIAFELRDSAHMQRACDWLGRNRIQILWGPVRHGPGHNIATYHRDPDGRVVELFYDLDRIIDEELGYFDPRPWHRDRPQRPKVWIGMPRDIWGVGPAPELTEFARKTAHPV